jgi:hypothetical protein
MAKTSTSFKPGVSGNPGGSPKDADVSALARRYTVDAIRAFVEVSRLTAPAHAAARVAAGRELVAIGYPGLGKGVTAGEGNALHLHLLAVTNHVAPGGHVHLTGEPKPDSPPQIEADDFHPFEFAEQALPGAADDLPDEALPLWDAFKARKARLEAENRTETPESGDLDPPNEDSAQNEGRIDDDGRQPD